MNPTTERRPFKVLTPQKHSTAMVIARYSGRIPSVIAGATPGPSRDILWKALRLAAVSAACAFSFLLMSQRNLLRRNNLPEMAPSSTQRVHFTPSAATLEVAPPPPAPAPLASPPPAEPDAKSLSDASDPPLVRLPTDKNLKVTEFSLTVSPEFQSLGNVQVKLSGVNTIANSYDITVKARGREFYRQDVPVRESLAVLKHGRRSPRIVVEAVAENRVYGYLAEPAFGFGRHRR